MEEALKKSEACNLRSLNLIMIQLTSNDDNDDLTTTLFLFFSVPQKISNIYFISVLKNNKILYNTHSYI